MINRKDMYDKCSNIPSGWELHIIDLVEKLVDYIESNEIKDYDIISIHEEQGRLRVIDVNGNCTTQSIISSTIKALEKICRYCGMESEVFPYNTCKYCYEIYISGGVR